MASKYAPQQRYMSKTIKRIVVNLNKNTDQDLITALESVENVQGYIKKLLRADLASKK